MEVASTLGIEAGRSSIITQIDETMKLHSMIVDNRHIMLMGDCMTYKV